MQDDRKADTRTQARSGHLGSGCIWTLDSEGTFTISTADGGSGTLWSPLLAVSPSLQSEVRRIVVADA